MSLLVFSGDGDPRVRNPGRAAGGVQLAAAGPGSLGTPCSPEWFQGAFAGGADGDPVPGSAVVAGDLLKEWHRDGTEQNVARSPPSGPVSQLSASLCVDSGHAAAGTGRALCTPTFSRRFHVGGFSAVTANAAGVGGASPACRRALCVLASAEHAVPLCGACQPSGHTGHLRSGPAAGRKGTEEGGLGGLVSDNGKVFEFTEGACRGLGSDKAKCRDWHR